MGFHHGPKQKWFNQQSTAHLNSNHNVNRITYHSSYHSDLMAHCIQTNRIQTNKMRTNWRMIKGRLSNTDLDKTMEVKVMNRILQCLLSLLTVTEGDNDDVDSKEELEDRL